METDWREDREDAACTCLLHDDTDPECYYHGTAPGFRVNRRVRRAVKFFVPLEALAFRQTYKLCRLEGDSRRQAFALAFLDARTVRS